MNKKEKIVLIVIVLLIIIILGYFLYQYFSNRVNPKDLKIELLGDKEIRLKWNKDTYEDVGATAKYKDEDLTKNIEVTNNVKLDKVGEYKYKYTIKYKGIKKTIERTIKVIDDIKPELTLNGNDNNFLILGTEYKDYGAKATDNYDGDITDKIVVDTSNLNKNKLGKYKVKYIVKDSSGNETSLERNIEVKNKGSNNQKVTVLNYHFFYKDQQDNKEKCGSQAICMQIDKFKDHLKYLNDNGFTTLTIKEFVSWMYGEIEIPEKSVLITIDDGGWGTAKDKGNYLIPALEEYKAHATLFLIAGWWEKKEYESPYLDIESHTWNLHHPGNCQYRSKVNCVPYDELLNDLKRAAYVLGSKEAFCFPFFEYTENSIKAVKEAGYKTAFVGLSRKASRNDDKYKIPRYELYDSITLDKFKSIVN